MAFRGGTMREGRTVYIGDKGSGGGCSCHTILVIAAVISTIISGFSWYSAAVQLRKTKGAMQEIAHAGVLEMNVDQPEEHVTELNQKVVHFSSNSVRSSMQDQSFNLFLENTLSLRRETEYCQWVETYVDNCATCYRDVTRTNSNGEQVNERESYSCNCVRTFYYTKGWRKSLIASIFFDQPAAHHNPSRNPYPSTTTVYSDNAVVGAMGVHLETPLVQKIRIQEKPVIFRSFEDIRFLRFSEAYNEHGFVYDYSEAHQQGYFFSPYSQSSAELLAKSFLQFLEGSLLDFQLGDLLPSCTAGDIRIQYYGGPLNGEGISGVGQVVISGPRESLQASVGLYHAQKDNFDFGLLQLGAWSFEAMVDHELATLTETRDNMRVFFGVSAVALVALALYSGAQQDGKKYL